MRPGANLLPSSSRQIGTANHERLFLGLTAPALTRKTLCSKVLDHQAKNYSGEVSTLTIFLRNVCPRTACQLYSFSSKFSFRHASRRQHSRWPTWPLQLGQVYDGSRRDLLKDFANERNSQDGRNDGWKYGNCRSPWHDGALIVL